MLYFRQVLGFLALALLLMSAPVAHAEGQTIIILDGSGSMWGQIDGRTKLEIARDALSEVVAGVPADTGIGLMAYGHRRKGDCSDIELVVPPGPGNGGAVAEAARKMKFLGMTPLTEAVRQAAAALKSTEQAATVILITDGLETCEGDPCALGAELAASGVDFTAHVVGFGLSDEEGRKVACLAENTGGRYIPASDAASLTEALRTTVVVAEPEPEPEPEPARLAENVDPAAILVAGAAEDPELAPDAVYEFYALDSEGRPGDQARTIYGRSLGQLPAGHYLMRTTLHSARAEQEVEVSETELVQPVAVLDVGIVDLEFLAHEGGEPDENALYDLRGPGDVGHSGYRRIRRAFPAGEYALTAKLGAASLSDSVVVTAGEVTRRTYVLGVGLAMVETYYVPGMKVTGGDHLVEVLSGTEALDGTREIVATKYGSDLKFELPPGDYIVRATLGHARAEAPVTVTPGARSDVDVILNAGVAAFRTDGDGTITIEAASTDIQGNREMIAMGWGPAWQTTLTAGDYVAVIKGKGDSTSETPFTVTAGARVEVTTAP